MPRNKALLDLLDELKEEPRPPRRMNLCVVCGGPIKSVNGRALCSAAVHVDCLPEHVATCATCNKYMEDDAKKEQSTQARMCSTQTDHHLG